jgi:hypothetical protein
MAEQKKDRYLARYSYIPLILVLILLAGVLRYENQKRKLEGTLLLLDTRIEKTADEKTEVVCRVRFIAEAGASTAVFLPADDEYGIGVSFVPTVSQEAIITLSRVAYAQRFFAKEGRGDPAKWGPTYAEASGGYGTTLSGEIGQDISLAGGSMGRNNVSTEYRVILNCEKMVDRADMKSIESSLFELNGEKLHQVNVAIPELMSAGVETNTRRGGHSGG